MLKSILMFSGELRATSSCLTRSSMKRLVVLFSSILVSTSFLLAQTQAALPPGSVPPAAAPAPAAPSQPSDQTVVEEIIVRINNSIISLSDLKRSQDQLAAESAKQDPNAPPDAQPKQQDLLRDLIDSKLLAQKADELGISADTDVIKRLDDIRKQMKAESMEDLEKAAQAQGVSFEEFKNNLKESILTQKVIQQEVGQHISVTQQEIQEYYNQHRDEMQRPEQVRLSEILISTQPPATAKTANSPPPPSEDDLVAQAKAKADAIYSQLQKGAKFADIAQKQSAGPTAAQGGDLEYFKRGTLSKQLEDQVFALKPGQYTEPIRTNQGWVILRVAEHTSEGVPPLKEVEPQIQERLYMEKMQPALRVYLTKLRENAYIDIKPGYVDTGASPNETKPVYTTAASSADSQKQKKKKKYVLF
jgi:peptidyl-prolyl cis-trans isomerase SurA